MEGIKKYQEWHVSMFFFVELNKTNDASSDTSSSDTSIENTSSNESLENLVCFLWKHTKCLLWKYWYRGGIKKIDEINMMRKNWKKLMYKTPGFFLKNYLKSLKCTKKSFLNFFHIWLFLSFEFLWIKY